MSKVILSRKKTIVDKDMPFNGKTLKRLEIREYKSITKNNEETYSIILYLKTSSEEVEVDYLGKMTKDQGKFEESYNFLCNYNGISSTLNRIIIDLDGGHGNNSNI